MVIGELEYVDLALPGGRGTGHLCSDAEASGFPHSCRETLYQQHRYTGKPRIARRPAIIQLVMGIGHRCPGRKQHMSSRGTAWIGLAVAVILCARPLQAQTIDNIDSQHSTAQLIIASSARDARINVGIARLTGELTENGDRQPTAIHFQIYPADKNPIEVLPGSALYNENAWNDTDIRFQSQHVEHADENSVCVSGTLTARYITRSAYYGPFRSYYGPTWGPPVMHTSTQQVIFMLQRLDQAGSGEWVATSSVSRSAFPVLWNAVVTTNWAPFVADGRLVEPFPRTDIRCSIPLNANITDFSGEVCSGTALDTMPEPEGPQPATSAARGRHASQEMAEELQIRLRLRLIKENAAPPNS